MSQSKLESVIEQVTNQLVGNIVSWCLNYFMLPLLGMPQSVKTATIITLIFSISSFIRGYMLRRFFNWLENREKVRPRITYVNPPFVLKRVPVELLTVEQIAKLTNRDKAWLGNWAGFYKIHETIEPVVLQYIYRAGSPDEGKIRINRNDKAPILISKQNIGAAFRKFKKITKLEEATTAHRRIIAYSIDLY